MLPEYFSFQLPTKVVYGAGLAGKLADELGRFGRRKVLLVTDRVIAGLGLPEKIEAGLKGSKVKVVATFDDVPPNSEITTVEACADLGLAAKANMIIAVGGGSVIDTAKVANILMKKGGRVADHQGAQLVTKPLFPLVVVPTTAGTGSEVTRFAVIADKANDVKLPFTEDYLQPELAVLDPEITATMPPRITGATGMDALTHAIEAYLDTEWSPASDAMALQAIQMIGRNILVAAAHPDDLEARGQMLAASCLAGIAFSHSMVGIVHGIAHSLGGVYGLAHGEANGLILPYGMEHNLESSTDRLADVAMALGGPQMPTPALTARMGILKVRMLSRKLSYLKALPPNLKQAGIGDGLARLDQVVETAMVDGSMLYNPCPVRPEAVERIVRRAYKQPAFPLPVSRARLKRAAQRARAREVRNAYKDTDDLYDVLGGFLLTLKDHPEIGPKFAGSNLLIRFNYRNPDASITIDATGAVVEYDMGESPRTAEVEMTMDADFAHAFWHGKANVVSALTRRQVTSRGAVQKAVKLLPILKPAFQLYPEYLRGKGLEHLVVG
jgi:alcohol dehydrogenase class IV